VLRAEDVPQKSKNLKSKLENKKSKLENYRTLCQRAQSRDLSKGNFKI
jgi:hypothetical protein